MLTATNILSFNGSDIHRLLDKAIKQHSSRPGGSTIKSKHKFVQIVIQMRRIREFRVMQRIQGQTLNIEYA